MPAQTGARPAPPCARPPRRPVAVLARRASVFVAFVAATLLVVGVPFVGPRVALAQDDPPPAADAPPGDASPPDAGPLPQLPPTESELARGLVVRKIAIVGNERLASDDVEAMLRSTRVGQPFAPEALAQDVREMWRTLYFEDVRVELTRVDAGVTLRVIVRERPSIKTIEFEGNDAIDADDLTEALSAEVKGGSILSYAGLRRGVQRIRDKYAEKGYFLAEADFEVVPQKGNEVNLKFKVVEHEKVTIRRIVFVGNHSVPDAKLREVMLTGQTTLLDFGQGASFRADAFERDIAVLGALYYDRGFLGVQIATPRVMITPDRSGLEITITINEGPRFKVRSVSVYEKDADGREVEPIGGRRALREKLRAKPGDWFSRAELAKDIGDIQRLYRDEGYANVEVPLDNDIDQQSFEVDVRVAIKRNKPVKFGRVEIRGNTKTRDRVIRRELEFAEQELFSETKLERSKRRITVLGYFERVDISTNQGATPDTLDVTVEIVEKPTGTFQVGAGFSSIENFIATAQIQQANLFGNGQAFALQAQISGLRQLIDFRLTEPYLFDTPVSGSINLYDRLNLFQQFSQNSLGGSLTVGYPIVNPELRVALTYTLENNEISTTTTSTLFGTAASVNVFRRLPLANLFNDGVNSSLRPSLTYDSRNNQLFPTEGFFATASAEFAPGFLGSDTEFVKYRANVRAYYPIWRNFILRFNSEGGVVTSPQDAGVPIYARFFLGGIFDLRGFRLRTIGPRLPLRDSLDENAAPIANGANIGGNLMYYQNLEIEFPIVDAVQLRGVVFTDLGNVWNLESLYCDAAPASPNQVTNPCFASDSIFKVRTSAGFGLRWFSPLGPLRFEWGFPFAPLEYEETSTFEFTIGNFF